MSARKGRAGARQPKGPPVKKQSVEPAEDMDSPNWPSVDKASFLEGLQLLNGNARLHSTALDEDLNITEQEQADEGRAGKKDIVKKAPIKQRGAAVKRKEKGGAQRENEPDVKKQKGTEKEAKNSPSRVTAGQKTARRKSSVLRRSGQPAAAVSRHLVGKKPAGRKSPTQTSAPRSVKSARRSSHNNPSQEQRNSDQSGQRKRAALSSDEEENKDTNLKPSPKKTTLRLKRKSPTEDCDSWQEGAADTETRKRPAAHQQTEFHVVLDAFLQFCDKYRESVESQQVQQFISTFSKNVKAQLCEKISSSKEFKVLKRENTKMCSLIRQKSRTLLDRKQEMLRTQNDICQLEKEKAQLQHRLTLLKRGHSFLHGIRELNRQYLDHRLQHPHQKETYGASCLAALLLETRDKKAALPQMKGDNIPAKKQAAVKK